ncbi:hypothetical protein PAMP_024321 [Pampus punctatissimus]
MARERTWSLRKLHSLCEDSAGSSVPLVFARSSFPPTVGRQAGRQAGSVGCELPKMAAASSIQPPSVHSSLAQESALSPEMDSPESRQPEDEEAAAAQPSEPGISLRDLPDLEPEEIERRLAKTRQELSNRRKILIKNLPPDTTNQVKTNICKCVKAVFASFHSLPLLALHIMPEIHLFD